MIDRRRSGSAEWIDRPSRTRGARSASLRMPAGSPAVHTVIARPSIPSALGSENTAIASSTASRFASGSPIPWNTTPCTRPCGKRARTTRTCSTISHAARLRCSPSLPVAQNAQPSAQPTCELTHTVNRCGFSSGIRTASNRAPSVPASKYFTNGSIALGVSATSSSSGTLPAARTASAAMRRTAEVAEIGSPRCTCAISLRASATVMAGTQAAKCSGVTAWSGSIEWCYPYIVAHPEVIRVFATSQDPDFDGPWQARTPSNSTGSAVVIGKGLLLTGAHVVANATFLQVQKPSQPDKAIARVRAVSHDCDLALLEVIN